MKAYGGAEPQLHSFLSWHDMWASSYSYLDLYTPEKQPPILTGQDAEWDRAWFWTLSTDKFHEMTWNRTSDIQPKFQSSCRLEHSSYNTQYRLQNTIPPDRYSRRTVPAVNKLFQQNIREIDRYYVSQTLQISISTAYAVGQHSSRSTGSHHCLPCVSSNRHRPGAHP